MVYTLKKIKQTHSQTKLNTILNFIYSWLCTGEVQFKSIAARPPWDLQPLRYQSCSLAIHLLRRVCTVLECHCALQTLTVEMCF
uniref:Uncharacterized protein n=1 Tax=Anguilla anguilla TaxID=7936 RepID=A0A0E9T2L0_ANGAN